MTGLKLPFWGLSFVEFWCWGLILGGQGGPGPRGPPWICPCTDWVNSYVIVEKDTGNAHAPNHTVKKKLRICLDPRDLNEALEREPYHTRSVDEITAKLQGMTVFTIVDFRKGYWMVVLHPDSRKLTCMALPFGRFQWTRLPMGTVVAQDIFQSKLDAIFIGMNGVTGIADDMIIAGKDEMEHDRNFQAFMEKCMENNLTLNVEKIQFKQKQVSFYGHVCQRTGFHQIQRRYRH